jgi:predicted nucleic acid-binding protein
MRSELIYWDSAAFLAYFQEEEGRVELCQGTLERAEAREILIVTSSLTLAECLWLRNNPPIPRDRADIVRRFFRRSFIRVRNVTRTVAEEAQVLVWDHGIRPKDAIHVATALEAKVPTIETFDEPLIGKSNIVGKPPLVIRTPVAPAQGRLFQ